MQRSSTAEMRLSGTKKKTVGSSILEPRGAFNRVNKVAAAYAREYAAEMVGRKWLNSQLVDNQDNTWAIADSTRKWLKQAIVDAFEIGWSPMQLAKMIQESGGFSKYAARMIAHTEIGNVNIQSHYEASQSCGATFKRTSLSADHNHDDVCSIAADAGEVPIDFVYPGGLKVPLFHPFCRCAISFYFR
jgi:hypothetical protein